MQLRMSGLRRIFQDGKNKTVMQDVFGIQNGGNMKKQFLSAILIFSMALSFCACGSINNGSSDEQGGVENSEDYIKEAGTDDGVTQDNADANKETVEEERPDWLSHLYEDPFFDWSIWITNIDWKAAGYGYQCRGTLEQEWETEHIYLTEYCGEVGDDRQLEEIDLSQYQSSEDIWSGAKGNL